MNRSFKNDMSQRVKPSQKTVIFSMIFNCYLSVITFEKENLIKSFVLITIFAVLQAENKDHPQDFEP